MNASLLDSMTEMIVDELHPEEVVLFGSHAKGTAGPDSDLDILIIVSDSEEAAHHRRRLTGRVYRRLAGLGVSKDILIYTQGEVDRWRDVPGHIVSTCLEEGRSVYARS